MIVATTRQKPSLKSSLSAHRLLVGVVTCQDAALYTTVFS